MSNPTFVSVIYVFFVLLVAIAFFYPTKPMPIPYLLFMACILVLWIATTTSGKSAGTSFEAAAVISFGALLLLIVRPPSRTDASVMINVLTAALVLMSAASVVRLLMGSDTLEFVYDNRSILTRNFFPFRFAGWFYDFPSVAVSSAFLVAVANTKRPSLQIPVMFVSFVTLVLADSKTAWLAVIFSCVPAIVIQSKSRKRIRYAPELIALCYASLCLLFFVGTAVTDLDVRARPEIWGRAIDIVMRQPLPQLETATETIAAHNSLLSASASAGVIAIPLVLIIVFMLIRISIKSAVRGDILSIGFSLGLMPVLIFEDTATWSYFNLGTIILMAVTLYAHRSVSSTDETVKA